ncbi:MAG: DUF6377 domain-containing protein [Prevotella sp.]|nr:DUF6377 domain-containing protein [Prevotella sp.]
MNRRKLTLLLVTAFTTLFANAQTKTPTLDDLDRELARSATYDRQFEADILKLKRQLHAARQPEIRYRLSDQVFNRYTPYCIDSAIVYANNKLMLAQKMGNKKYIDDSKLNVAYLMIKCGQLKDASDLVLSIRRDQLDPDLSFYFFSTRKTLFEALANAALTPQQQKEYRHLSEINNDSVVSLNASPDVWSRAEQLTNNEQDEQAKEILLKGLAKLSPYDRRVGFVAYALASIYGRQKDTEAQKQYLIAAAISDIRNSVKEYLALQQLAVILFDEGDTKRAYAYMDHALDDAIFCNARQRTIAMTDVWPVIQKSHERETTASIIWLTVGLILIGLLSVFLFVMIIYTRRRVLELKAIRAQLSGTNDLLKESNAIKDEYITRFLAQCSTYIDKLDTYRKHVYRLFTSGKRTELLETLRSQDVVDRELESFYSIFDETFLGLFPSFVKDFNALLKPGEQIIPKQAGHLSTDLRIFALIRLGVKENELICSFLRCSKATVYAYRSRVRLKSLDPEKFDQQVMLL